MLNKTIMASAIAQALDFGGDHFLAFAPALAGELGDLGVDLLEILAQGRIVVTASGGAVAAVGFDHETLPLCCAPRSGANVAARAAGALVNPNAKPGPWLHRPNGGTSPGYWLPGSGTLMTGGGKF